MGKCYVFKQLLNNTKVKGKSRAGSLKFVSLFSVNSYKKAYLCD